MCFICSSSASLILLPVPALKLMANLRININNRFYDITCDKNNEKYVLELSKQLDSKVKQLSLSVKNVDPSRLLVLTGILLCEEIDQILKKKSSLDNPYSMNYKNQVLEIKEQQKQKMQNYQCRRSSTSTSACGHIREIL